MGLDSLAKKIRAEREHARVILEMGQSNWGWNTPAGQIRRERRAQFLCEPLRAARASGASPVARVLELGCGTGTFTGDLLACGVELTSLDIAEDLLTVARSRFPGARFVQGDAHRLPFDESAFDAAVGCSVLHHLEWEPALAQLRRVLKTGAPIRFSEPNLVNPQIYLQKNWGWLKKRAGDSPGEYAFTASQIEDCLERVGFGEIVVEPYEFLHPATPRALIGTVIGLEQVLERTALRSIAGSIRISARAR